MPSDFRYADIPSDKEDGRSSLVHRALILTGKVGEIRPILLLPAWLALIYVASRPWLDHRAWAALSVAISIAVDWAMLAGLPLAQRSWGPVSPPLLGLAAVHAGLTLAMGLVVPGLAGLLAVSMAHAALATVAIYATWIEPFQIRVAHQKLHPTGWPTDHALRVLHISDLHFEGPSLRERRLVDLVRAQKPDLILLTGDYLNLSSVYSREAQQGARKVLSQLEASRGIYAVVGSPVVDVPSIVPDIFEGLPIRWLHDEAVTLDIGQHQLIIMGVRNTYRAERDTAALQSLVDRADEDATRVLLYHTPDLAPAASTMGIDLCLCGHTHGGQLRVPFYGALATSSRWGKRYEQGRYKEGTMVLYVCRGLGVEGLGAPRARFLAPPEIVVWDIAAH